MACFVCPCAHFCVSRAYRACAVKVRVGHGVDTVGMAGKPKRITGFQTHTTPVLLAAGERAELATDECKEDSVWGAGVRLRCAVSFGLFFLLCSLSLSRSLRVTRWLASVWCPQPLRA